MVGHTDSSRSPEVQPAREPAKANCAPAEPIPPALAGSPDYEVIREISRGGMGVVYLARNRRMDRLEGLKVVKQALLARAGALERFEREMRSAARLSHPNIVTAYSSPPLEGLLAFAMEYVDGIDLYQLVKARGPLPVSNACYYVSQAAKGLQHAFEREMVHRDIKPNNLMLQIDGKKQVIKILDFGLAKATSENPIDGGLTREGQMLGTPHYMAPEQSIDAAKADIRADIYSLGCTLIFLLTGAPPFDAKESLYEILQAHQSQVPRPLNEVRGDVPAELAAIIAKMTAKDPAQRYQQPAEVAQALNPFFKQGIKALPAGEARFATPPPATTPSDTAGSGASHATNVPGQPAAGAGAPAVTPVKSGSTATDPMQARLEPIAEIESRGMRPEPASGGRRRFGMPPLSRALWIGLAAGAFFFGFVGLWASGVFAPDRPRTAPNGDKPDFAHGGDVVTPVLEPPHLVSQDEPSDADGDEASEIRELPSTPSAVATDSPEMPATEKAAAEEPPASSETDDTPPTDVADESSPREPRPPEVLRTVRKTRDDEVKKAEKALLAQFEKEISLLAKARTNPETRLHLIEAVKAEKNVFETRKLIPWSPLMRNAVLAYLRDLDSANIAVKKAYDRHIAAAMKAKDDPTIAKLRAEMLAAAPRELLGTWICTAGKNSWTWKLFSDGTLDFQGKRAATGDEWLWAIDRNFLVVSTRHANDPRVQVIDHCIISADGTIFTAENNRKDRFSGKLGR